VNDDLTGRANEDWVSRYINFAQSPLGTPSSRFGSELGTKCRGIGIKIGRADPKLDPKGVLTVRLRY
jgi:molybdate/tungstate transport system substrate-binding protein